jgi:hypothetical protein
MRYVKGVGNLAPVISRQVFVPTSTALITRTGFLVLRRLSRQGWPCGRAPGTDRQVRRLMQVVPPRP